MTPHYCKPFRLFAASDPGNFFIIIPTWHFLTIIYAHVQMSTSERTSYFYKEFCDLNFAPFPSQASLNSLCCFFKKICFMHISALPVCTHMHHVCA